MKTTDSASDSAKLVAEQLKILESLTRYSASGGDNTIETERKTHRAKSFLSASMIWLVIGALTVLGLWARQAELDAVVRGVGQVIPDTSTQIIQSLEGGIVAEMAVGEGERIEKGQLLVRIHDMQFSAMYRENLGRRDILAARVARLKAEAKGDAQPEFSDQLIRERPDLVAAERERFEIRLQRHEAQVAEIQSRLATARQKYEAVRPAIESGAISETERIEVEGNIDQLEKQLVVLETGFRGEASDLLEQDEAVLAGLEESLPADADRLKRTEIRSPVAGIVNAIFIKTEGRVVKSGDPIMEIVPEDGSLLIEAKLKPADIAFLHEGLPTKVRFTAYDYAAYGGLEGKIETIGADTVAGPEGEEFYPIKVRTERNSLGNDTKTGERLDLVPGMVAEVDIITGKRTVIDYLLKPINRARQRALREK